MLDAARTARGRAHAPYSRFAVGAALLTADGAIHVGCNVENASYGLSVCAERHAVAAAVAAGHRTFEAVLVMTDTAPPVGPCGACRQVLAEFGDFPVLLADPSAVRSRTSVARLLPDAFRAGDLPRDR
jgi:cytidine deaminase